MIEVVKISDWYFLSTTKRSPTAFEIFIYNKDVLTRTSELNKIFHKYMQDQRVEEFRKLLDVPKFMNYSEPAFIGATTDKSIATLIKTAY